MRHSLWLCKSPARRAALKILAWKRILQLIFFPRWWPPPHYLDSFCWRDVTMREQWRFIPLWILVGIWTWHDWTQIWIVEILFYLNVIFNIDFILFFFFMKLKEGKNVFEILFLRIEIEFVIPFFFLFDR